MIATLLKPIQYPTHYRRPHRRNLRYHVRSCYRDLVLMPVREYSRCVSSQAHFKAMTLSGIQVKSILPHMAV